MKFFKNLLRRKPEIKSSSGPVIGLTPELGSFLLFGGIDNAATASSAIALYNDSSAVSIPVNKIAEAFASIQPVVEDKDGNITTDHPVLELLKKPSPFHDRNLFLETIGKNYLITNDAHVVGLGNINRPPLELWPISPTNTSFIKGSGGIPVNIIVSGETLAGDYRLELKKSRARYIRDIVTELYQIRGFSTVDNGLLRGQSMLVNAANEVRQHILGNNHNVALLEKGGRLSLVFNIEEDLNPDDFNSARDKILATYGGKNKNFIGVTAGGKMTINELGNTNRDMDFVKLQKLVRETVALQYKYPLPLISNEASTYNNYREAKLALFDDAVLPLADRVFAGLTQFLMPRFGIDSTEQRITYNILTITTLRDRVLEELKKRKDINIESDNELRPLLAREPYENGDVILKPSNLVPAGTDLLTDDESIVIRGARQDLTPDETEEIDEEDISGE